MFLQERQDKIVELINSEGRATVDELAERFEVTHDCIRKDLKQLGLEGKIQRVYGGAVSIASAPERNVTKRINTNVDAKQAIAEKAFELICDGDTIYLDVSTTTLALAEMLAQSQKSCTVISNMMEIMRTLSANPLIDAVCTGGRLSRDLDGFVGSNALDVISKLHFDCVFMGALAIDLGGGEVLTYDIDDGMVKELAIKNSRRAVLLADKTKFAARGTYCFAHMSDFESLVCDSPSASEKKALKKLGVNCL